MEVYKHGERERGGPKKMDQVRQNWEEMGIGSIQMQHESPRTENAGEYLWASCQYVLWHRHGIKSSKSIDTLDLNKMHSPILHSFVLSFSPEIFIERMQ